MSKTWRRTAPFALAALAALTLACGGGDDSDKSAEVPTSVATQAPVVTAPPSLTATLPASPSPIATTSSSHSPTPTPIPEVALVACGFNRPIAIAFGPDGDLYAANRVAADPAEEGRTISRVAPTGAVTVFVTDLVTDIQWVVGPVDIAFSPGGDLYVSDTFFPRVFKLSPEGEPRPFLAGFAERVFIGFDEDDGGLYVTHRGSILEYDTNGVLILVSNAAFDGIGPIAVDDAKNLVFTIDPPGNVYAMDQSTGQMSQVLDSANLRRDFAIGNTRDIALGPDGFLYVSASSVIPGNTGRVLRIDPSDWSATPFVDGLADPGALAFDDAGNLFITTGVTGGLGMVLKSRPEGGTAPAFDQRDCGVFSPQP